MSRLAGDVVSAADRTADPGIYVALEHVEELLIGVVPGGTKGQIKELRPTIENQIASDANYEIWRQAYTAILARSINENRDVDLELLAIQTYHRASEQVSTDAPIVETATELDQ